MRVSVPSEFKDVATIDGLIVDLRYASENNFTGRNVYGGFRLAYLHEVAHAKLARAVSALTNRDPLLRLLILDALRPRRAQRELFAHVKGTAQQKYVADPDRGSVHCYGFAVDLTLADENGNELDMGTAFDEFVDLAEPRHEERFLNEGRLSPKQFAHRHLLRSVMQTAGFASIEDEWWHFDALPLEKARSEFQIIE